MSTKSDVPWVYLCLKVQYAWPQAGARLALGLPHAWPANGHGEPTAIRPRERDRAGAGRRAAVVTRASVMGVKLSYAPRP
jgi:hypothetical protein